MTPLDAAWAACGDGEDAEGRLRFFALLLETPLCLPLQGPGSPLTVALDGGAAALAFDDDARMAAFFEAPTEYVTLTGRALAALLAARGLGLGLNFGDAPSAQLLDAAAVAWLAAEMGGRLEPEALEGPLRLSPPNGAAPSLPAALAAKLADHPGMVAGAWLARLGREGDAGRLTALIVPAQAARRAAEGLCAALAAAAAPHAPAGEAVDAAVLDAAHPLAAAAARVGLPLHAPPETPRAAAPAAQPRPRPRPPRLR